MAIIEIAFRPYLTFKAINIHKAVRIVRPQMGKMSESYHKLNRNCTVHAIFRLAKPNLLSIFCLFLFNNRNQRLLAMQTLTALINYKGTVRIF